MKKEKKLIKVSLPVIIILIGMLFMGFMIWRRPEPGKEVLSDPGVLVHFQEIKRKTVEIVVRGTGTVKAADEVSVIPQVSGRITGVSPDFVAGGFIRKNDLLFTIEDTDYRLALEHAKSAKAKAEYELATIESQARIARAEWERLNPGSLEQPHPLVLFEPQMKNALALLASAAASVKQAELDLERTVIRAPFNGRVRSESVNLNQYVKSGSSVAVLSGTDTAEISVPMTLDDQQWLTIPRSTRTDPGSPAVVSLNRGDEIFEWHGHVVRATGEVDHRNRMMDIVVLVDDPYLFKSKPEAGRPALAEGSFVTVSIRGRTFHNTAVIPRTAFRDDSTVWVMDNEDRLRIQKVVPLRLERDEVIISEGLNDGERIILTNISGAADGMKLRAVETLQK